MKTLGIFILITMALMFIISYLEVRQVGIEKAKEKSLAIWFLSAIISLGITLAFFY